MSRKEASIAPQQLSSNGEAPTFKDRAANKKHIQQLFTEYDALAKKRSEAETLVEAATQALSDKVKELSATYGKAPWVRQGRHLMVTMRKNEETGRETWFFRAPKEQGTEV